MILVVAGNYRQAQFFARGHRLGPHEWVYVDDPRRILAVARGSQLQLVGRYREHPQYAAIMDVAAYRQLVVTENPS